jgi:hypothetical protein
MPDRVRVDAVEDPVEDLDIEGPLILGSDEVMRSCV